MPARGFHLKCTLQAVLRLAALVSIRASPGITSSCAWLAARGAVGDPAFVPLSPPRSFFHRESGPSSRQMMMSALAGVVVAAGAQVSRPRPRPRGGRRAGSVGRDEQRRQGPRVIGVGGGAAQHWCRAEAAGVGGGQDEQRRRGPRVIRVGGGVAQRRCCAEAAV